MLATAGNLLATSSQSDRSVLSLCEGRVCELVSYSYWYITKETPAHSGVRLEFLAVTSGYGESLSLGQGKLPNFLVTRTLFLNVFPLPIPTPLELKRQSWIMVGA